MHFERTLAHPADCEGVGLHTGRHRKMRLVPAPAGTGRVFVRTDLGGAEIPASIDPLGPTTHATCLVQGQARISTAEHLLAALYALGVDNLHIELDGDEVPILDGSAAPF